MEQERLDGRFLIYLISCALSGKKALSIWDGVNLENVLRISKKHKITAMAYNGIDDSIIDRQDLKNRFFQEETKALYLQGRQDIEKELLYNTFRDNRIRFMPLKGLVIKDIYPQAYFRTMSDFDILVDKENMSKVRELLEKNDYTTEEFGLEHHDKYRKNDNNNLYVEIHRDLMPGEGEMFELYSGFEEPWREESIVRDTANDMLYRQTPDEFYIFMLAHAAKHFFMSGFGIRLVIDVGVYRKKYKKELNFKYIYKRLGMMKILRFSQTIEKLADIWLDEDADLRSEALFKRADISSKESEDIDAMELNIIGTTVHGDASQFRASSAESGRISSKKSLVIISGLRRLFPKSRYMKIDYPVLNKCGWLLPVCWVIRIFKWLFSGKRSEFSRELDAIKQVDYDLLEFKRSMKD